MEIQCSRQQTLSALHNLSAHANKQFDKATNDAAEIYSQLSTKLYNMQQSIDVREAEQQNKALSDRKMLISEKLGPTNYEVDQQRASDQRAPSSGDWILQHPKFSNWLEARTMPDSILYINGMPGAGRCVSILTRVILTQFR
jgi:hypothetical protein